MTVLSRQLDSFVVQVIAGRHSIIGDEPVEMGGTDFGPSPFALLMAALGN